MTVRVSHLNDFKRWKEDEDLGVGWLIDRLTKGQESEAMAKGTALHKALELACEYDYDEIEQDGYTFHFTADMEIELPAIREQRRYKDYGGIVVSGQADGVSGHLLIDYKTTETFDAERYLSGVQHNFYMDIFGCTCFRWYIFECRETDTPKHYCVNALHKLEQYPYLGMERDCRELAQDFKRFLEVHLPNWQPEILKEKAA